jgi:Ricin-type beta-trefoil lectin domain-like/Right handed beta helix region
VKTRHLIKQKLLLYTLLSAGTLVSGSSLVAAGPYYVSAQNGNDSWSGLLSSPNSTHTDGPFYSLTAAQAAMRRSTVKTVNVRAGTYSMSSTWQFTSADNGEQWILYPGETAILDGGGATGVNLNNGGVNNITFEGLTFRNMGPTGLSIGNSDSITLRWNTFQNCNTICISGGHVTNSIMDSNTINGLSPGSVSGPSSLVNYAISFWYGSSNNQITHNLLENCQGGGIAFGANQGDLPFNNNIIDSNIFENIGSVNATDMGGIYLEDGNHSSTGNHITNNIFSGIGGPNYQSNWSKSIYLDDGMTDVLISGNVCSSCGNMAYQLHGSDHITMVNNIFNLSSAGTQLILYQLSWSTDYGMSGNIFERNIIYYSGSPSYVWNVQINPGDALPTDSTNLYYSATGATIPNGPVVVDVKPVYANPNFNQPSAGNYSMPSSSPAYSLIGFQPLPTNQGPLPGGPQGGSSSGPVANGIYTIKNNSSGLVLDDPASAPPGAQVIQYWQNYTLTLNQRWTVTYNSSSQAYTIVNQSSGGYLTDNATALFESSPTGNASQLWTISSGSGAYVIRNVGTGRVIDDPNSNTSTVGIITWPANGGSNQGWIFQ